MTTFEQASAAQDKAEARAKRRLGVPVGSGLTPSSDGWAVRLYLYSQIADALRADLAKPIGGVPVLVDVVAKPTLHGRARRKRG
jgi:tetrahydromethanopterin S-methyltransferase subunit H